MKKVALLTGSSRGIGAACARRLSQDGYAIAIHCTARRQEAEALQKELPNSMVFQADLSDPTACEALIKDVKEKMGHIDVLVNNAGISIDQVIPFAKLEDFERLLSVNVKAVFLLTKLASKLMIRKKQGVIINLSSVVGYQGNAGQSMYAATKGAITAFTKSVAQDLAPFGIRCNCIAPGFIETDMTRALDEKVRTAILSRIPQQRLGTPEEIANAVSFLVSDQASYITGASLHVNGGMYPN
jgi:3-oxoacyl-[acyl-carrier protein] reductase